MRRRALACVIVCCLVGLAGCSLLRPRVRSGPSERAPAASEYFPAAVGTRWEYAGSGNEFAAFTAEATHREGNLAQVVVMSGAAVAYVYEILPERVTERLRRAEIDTVENFLHEKPTAPRDILRGPLAAGLEWTNPVPDPADPQGSPAEETRRIEAVGITVETPAGRFERVIKVRIRGPVGPDVVEYYAPGVGLVRREFLSEEPVISELSRFVPPPSAP
ncbi:MAG TPA: hypothetical protein VF234_04415 [Limnochordia bacterium]